MHELVQCPYCFSRPCSGILLSRTLIESIPPGVCNSRLRDGCVHGPYCAHAFHLEAQDVYLHIGKHPGSSSAVRDEGADVFPHDVATLADPVPDYLHLHPHPLRRQRQ